MYYYILMKMPGEKNGYVNTRMDALYNYAL